MWCAHFSILTVVYINLKVYRTFYMMNMNTGIKKFTIWVEIMKTVDWILINQWKLINGNIRAIFFGQEVRRIKVGSDPIFTVLIWYQEIFSAISTFLRNETKLKPWKNSKWIHTHLDHKAINCDGVVMTFIIIMWPNYSHTQSLLHTFFEIMNIATCK